MNLHSRYLKEPVTNSSGELDCATCGSKYCHLIQCKAAYAQLNNQTRAHLHEKDSRSSVVNGNKVLYSLAVSADLSMTTIGSVPQKSGPHFTFKQISSANECSF